MTTDNNRFTFRAAAGEAKLLLVGIPVFIWTVLPVYHLCLFAFSEKQSAFSGNWFPEDPTLRNFEVVFGQKHYFLNHFWQQLWNSTFIAAMVGFLASDEGRFITGQVVHVNGGMHFGT